MTRYVIVGAGAVGVTFAAELARVGRDVLLVARGAQLEALRAGRLRYVRPDGVRLLDLPAAGGPDEVRLVAGDVLVLATKAQDVEAAVAEWAWREVRRPGRAPSSAAAAVPVLTLQNGLAADRIALRRFATVFGGVLGLPASYVEPGEVVSPGAPAVGTVWVGVYPAGSDPRLAGLVEDLRAAGFEAGAVSDVTGFKTAKLLLSVTFALDALYEPGARRDEAARALAEEAREILTAGGLPVGDLADEPTVDVSRFAVAPIAGYPGRGNSTWQSRTRDGSLETDFLNGEIVLRARLLGRSAPLNEALVERIHRAAREGTPARSLGGDDVLATFPSLRPAAAGEPTRSEVLIDAVTLRRRLGEPNPPALLDVRWALGDPHGREHHRAGHLPGAVYVDLDGELSGPPSAAAGRHPLPGVGALTEAARRWGLRGGQPVVVYDDSGGQAAARAWWLLRWAGVADVRILDGGLAAWNGAGFAIEGGEGETKPGDVVLDGCHLPVLTADQAAVLARDGVLLDARAGERYRGETEPVDSRAGHIPGAVSAPTAGNLTADGTFAAAGDLRARFAALGVTAGGRPVGVYCGSGVTAAHEIAALRVAGIDAALFPGSWSAWSADPRREVATGHNPG